ncbi:MAG: Fe(3+) dicitrate transport protein [Lentimonas sp.]|jgi:Fe(3+) dicitrate transport protein
MQAQLVEGRIMSPEKERIPFAKISNLQNGKNVLSNVDGEFSIEAKLFDTLACWAYGYDTLLFPITELNKLKISLSHSFLELQEAIVERERLEKFDVGILAPVRGVQITTGTNALISLESLQGAKSSGNPRELFGRIPGLNIWESDGSGIQIGIGGRGLSPNRAANFNTRQNGYDISADALGYPESYYTPPIEALSAIEIIRGSASLQFGTQFGGLLNFVIREPESSTPFEFTNRATVGQYGYLGNFTRISGTQGRWSYQSYYQIKTGKGYRENSEFTQQQFFSQLQYRFNEKTKLRLEYTHMDYLTQQAGGLSDLSFKQDPIQSFRDRNWFKVNWNMLALHFDYQLTKNTLFNIRTFGMLSDRSTLGFLGKITQQDPGGNREMIYGDFKNIGSEARLLKKYTLKNQMIKGAFVVGARYYRGQTTSKQGRSSDGDGPDFGFINPNELENSSFSFPSSNIALFAENIVFIGNRWSVNFGVRNEIIESSAKGYYKKYNVHPLNGDTLATLIFNDSNEVKRNVPLFGAGVSYKIKSTTNAYFNFTQNYRAINFTDIRINNPNIIVDSNIQDENGYTFELGLRGTFSKNWTFDLAAFSIFYGNKIGLAPNPGTTSKIRTNIGDAVNYGVELFSEIDIIGVINDSAKHQLFVFTNLAYISSEYIRSLEPNYVGKQVEYVAPIIARGGIKWQYKKLTSQIQISYTSDQFSDASNAIEPSGDAVIGLVPNYTVIDLSSRYKLSDRWLIEAGVNNLTNAKYFTRRASGYPGPGILPSDGISFYGTVQFKFGIRKK